MSKQTDVIASEEELLKIFRPRDRKHVLIPNTMRFPLPIGHYLAWTEPSGVRLYLVFKKPEWQSAVGIVFRRDQQGSAISPPVMCDWCQHHGPSDQVGMLTTAVDARRRIGVILCLDLGCLERLEQLANMSGKNFDKMARALNEKMARFSREALNMEAE